MHLDRALVVVERRAPPDGSYTDFDIRHIEGPLKSSGMVDNIDILYYNDYTPNCNDALINYCLQKKPRVVLLSLQMVPTQKKGEPTPDCIWKITHQLSIPTVAFWFDVWIDRVAETLERYLPSITLNMMLGADGSSHKTLPLKGTNYIYTGLTFDERLFSKPEGIRDIPVGILGSLLNYRRPWIDGLREFGIPVYTGGGQLVGGKLPSLLTDEAPPLWMPYEEYIRLTSRLKIALNFSAFNNPDYHSIASPARRRAQEVLDWLAPTLKSSFSVLKNPRKAKNIIPTLKNGAKILLRKARYQPRARVWEALWCRTFLLEGDNPVTSIYFEPYVDYVPFTTLRDLVDKIRYYLENEGERDRIRMHGRATVEKYYNARIYWENTFEAIGMPSGGEHYHHPGEIWNKAHFDNWYLSTSTRNMRDL